MSTETKAVCTPGPWRVDRARNGEINIRSDDFYVATAWAGLDFDAENDPTAIANARLIAAAPSLLEHGYSLAMQGLQSDRYAIDPQFRETVDNLLALKRQIEGGS